MIGPCVSQAWGASGGSISGKMMIMQGTAPGGPLDRGFCGMGALHA